jgi:hypothetical protein
MPVKNDVEDDVADDADQKEVPVARERHRPQLGSDSEGASNKAENNADVTTGDILLVAIAHDYLQQQKHSQFMRISAANCSEWKVL